MDRDRAHLEAVGRLDETEELPEIQWLDDSVELVPYRYYIPKLVPNASLLNVNGSGKQGKGTFAKTLLARISTGTLPGDFEGKPRAVVATSWEEDWDKDVKPAVILAGADPKMFAWVKPVKRDGAGLAEYLRSFLGFIEGRNEVPVGAIWLDSIKDFFLGRGERADQDNQQVRDFLAPLANLAREHDLLVLAVTHPRKDGGNSTSGAAAWNEFPRQTLHVTKTTLKVTYSNLGNLGEGITIVGERGVVGPEEVEAWITRFPWDLPGSTDSSEAVVSVPTSAGRP